MAFTHRLQPTKGMQASASPRLQKVQSKSAPSHAKKPCRTAKGNPDPSSDEGKSPFSLEVIRAKEKFVDSMRKSEEAVVPPVQCLFDKRPGATRETSWHQFQPGTDKSDESAKIKVEYWKTQDASEAVLSASPPSPHTSPARIPKHSPVSPFKSDGPWHSSEAHMPYHPSDVAPDEVLQADGTVIVADSYKREHPPSRAEQKAEAKRRKAEARERASSEGVYHRPSNGRNSVMVKIKERRWSWPWRRHSKAERLHVDHTYERKKKRDSGVGFAEHLKEWLHIGGNHHHHHPLRRIDANC